MEKVEKVSELEAANSQVLTLESTIASLQLEVKQYKEEIQVISAQKESAIKTKDHLSTEVQELTQKLEIEAEGQSLKQKNFEDLQKDIDNRNQIISGYKESLEDAREQKEAAEEKYRALYAEIEAKDQDRSLNTEKIREECSKYKEVVRSLEAQNASLENDLATSVKNITELKQKLQTLEDSKKELQSSISDIQVKKDEAQESVMAEKEKTPQSKNGT